MPHFIRSIIVIFVRRKPLYSDDMADHSFENEIMDVIWAQGQQHGNYIHQPKTGLDQGKAKILDFYREDEIKYHGHKSQRGKTTINFLSKLLTSYHIDSPYFGFKKK